MFEALVTETSSISTLSGKAPFGMKSSADSSFDFMEKSSLLDSLGSSDKGRRENQQQQSK
jgi:hypothetical protein